MSGTATRVTFATAAMGLERIDFVWYVKNISLLAIGGYFAGALVYILQVTLLS